MHSIIAFTIASGWLLCASALGVDKRPEAHAAQIREPNQVAMDVFGHKGCKIIRSAQEWDEVQGQLAAIGTAKPGADKPLAADFAKQRIVCFFNYGDEGDKFAVRSYAADANSPRLDIVMSYVIYKTQKQVINGFNYLLVVVPATETLSVNVLTFDASGDGPHPTPDKAQLEWSRTLGPDTGDSVDGLEAHIATKATTVKPGQDVVVQFTLCFADPAVVQGGKFALDGNCINVWDGKYSKGYRNHAFDVTGPDGKTVRLRPKAHDWDKNAPHPEAVGKNKPYVLPGWTGETFRSLKELGLDTAAPGTYAITGVYQEKPGDEPPRSAVAMWAGTARSNTIRVEVKD